MLRDVDDSADGFGRDRTTRKGSEAHGESPFDSGTDAELVAFGIRKRYPLGFPNALNAGVQSSCAECLEPGDLGFDLVGDDVEVHPVFSGPWFGHLLEDEGRGVSVFGDEDGEGVTGVIDPIPQGVSPEAHQLLGVGAVEHEIESRLAAHDAPLFSVSSSG